MSVPADYQARLLTASDRAGWLDWSLDFFTHDHILQVPYVDITLQLEVGNAYQRYQEQPNGGSFFAFLVWQLMQTLKNHLSFKLRLINQHWYIVENPPIFIPVAIGGAQRFADLFLENVSLLSYAEFSAYYQQQLQLARNGKASRVSEEGFFLAQFFGNLPNLQFSGLTLHHRQGNIAGQSFFYFGKRYTANEQLLIPFAAKLHHACTDPFVLDLLLQDFQQQL